ncbi:phage baseplate assembly protein [Gluconobacter sp. LMG 31484]|uniref:Phage baseplate assembly protein n=1 Tax=Gluconobacter vitians TaxID=2728102 RepID=A0ABR9Y4M9_9PROT|nr:phage baseplate assembly protein [Gluconobacter vitians]MBF0858792.1 phage baseplate assembly protein [Gluconobacter vitians]
MSDPLTELHYAQRSQTLRGVVQDVNDTGPDQTVSVQMHYGQERSSVPVHQPFGFSSHAPVDGAVTHVVQNGGDPSDLFALPPANPSAARMSGIQEGETILYDATGQKVYLQGGKIVRIDALEEMRVSIGGQTVLDVTPEGVTITGGLIVSKGIKAGDDVVAGSISLQNHLTTQVMSGNGTSGKPK